MEGIQKAYLLCQNGILKDKRLHLGSEPSCITLVQYALQVDTERLQNTKLLQHINQLQFNNINS